MNSLPFLKKNKISNSIAERVTEKGFKRIDADEPESYSMEDLEACATDIIDAILLKDTKKLAMALKSAFEICDSQPHVEGEHIEQEEIK